MAGFVGIFSELLTDLAVDFVPTEKLLSSFLLYTFHKKPFKNTKIQVDELPNIGCLKNDLVQSMIIFGLTFQIQTSQNKTFLK